MAASNDGGALRTGAASVREWIVELFAGRDFSPKQLLVARYLEANPHAAAVQTAGEIAQHSGVNAATVVRFAQALGFKGWPSLQVQMRNEAMAGLLPSGLMESQAIDPSMKPVDAAIERDLRNLRTALETVDHDEVQAIAELIARSRRTVIVSAGSFAAVGQIITYNGRAMGFPITLETRGGVDLMVAISDLDEGDCLIGISFWRLARHVVLALQSAQRRGVPTVAFTDSTLSPLTEHADHAIVVPSDGIVGFQSMTAAISVAYGLIAALQQTASADVDKRMRALEALYFELDILYR